MTTQQKLNSMVNHAFSMRDKLKKESEEWSELASELLNLYLTRESDDFEDDDGRC
jgi:hypothetical protein